MMPSTRMPSQMWARRMTNFVVMSKDPTLAFVSTLAECLDPPSRSALHHSLDFGG